MTTLEALPVHKISAVNRLYLVMNAMLQRSEPAHAQVEQAPGLRPKRGVGRDLFAR